MVTLTHGQADRQRSFRLVADAMRLPGRRGRQPDAGVILLQR
jgi:hypothetical protein